MSSAINVDRGEAVAIKEENHFKVVSLQPFTSQAKAQFRVAITPGFSLRELSTSKEKVLLCSAPVKTLFFGRKRAALYQRLHWPVLVANYEYNEELQKNAFIS